MEQIGETIIYGMLIILTLAGMWKTYEKAGETGWKAIIPIYNMVVLARIIKKPWWWALLMLIPYLGVIWSVWAMNLLSKSFGKDVLYTIGLVIFPFIFYPVLGFGKAKFIGLDSSINESEDTDVVDDIKEAAENMYESTQEVVSESAEQAAENLDNQEDK